MTAPNIGPEGGASQRFAEWFASEKLDGLSVREIASLGFDAGHAFWHAGRAALSAASPPEPAERRAFIADGLLVSAVHALRSYQYGNASTELAESMANKIVEFRSGHQAEASSWGAVQRPDSDTERLRAVLEACREFVAMDVRSTNRGIAREMLGRIDAALKDRV